MIATITMQTPTRVHQSNQTSKTMTVTALLMKPHFGDDDGDGFTEGDNDCNDRNPDINPGAESLRRH